MSVIEFARVRGIDRRSAWRRLRDANEGRPTKEDAGLLTRRLGRTYQALASSITLTDDPVREAPRSVLTAETLRGLSLQQREIANARLAWVKGVVDFCEKQGLSRTRGVPKFLVHVETDSVLRSQLPTSIPLPSPRSLLRWIADFATGGLAKLADRRKQQKLKPVAEQHPELVKHLRGFYYAHPDAGSAMCYQWLKAKIPAKHLPHPRHVQRIIARDRQENTGYEYRKDPHRWRSRKMPAFGTIRDGLTRLNQRIEMDNSSFDALTVGGRRWAITVAVDCFSSWSKARLVEISNAKHIARFLADVIRERGRPEAVVVDNGLDYSAEIVASMCDHLGIRLTFCPPRAAWKKPFIERKIGQIHRQGLLPLLPGYTGSNTQQRRAIQERHRLFREKPELLSPDELQRVLDDICLIFQHFPNAGLDGRTTFDVELELQRQPIEAVDDEVLDILLMDRAGQRTIAKDGVGVPINGRKCWYVPDTPGLIGNIVKVHLTEDRQKACLYHIATNRKELQAQALSGRRPAGHFLCTATLREADAIALVQRAKEAERQRLMRDVAELREASVATNAKDARHDIVRSIKERVAKVKALPRRRRRIDTPGIREVREAMEALRAAPAPMGPLDVPRTDIEETAWVLNKVQAAKAIASLLRRPLTDVEFEALPDEVDGSEIGVLADRIKLMAQRPEKSVG